MLDTRLQERFARRYTDAAFGYTAATTAAYAAFAEQVFDFWAGVFEPPERREAKVPQFNWGWPMPAPKPASRQELAPNPFLPFTWPVPQSRSVSVPAADPFAGANAMFTAWLSMFSYAAPPAAWPMAFTMIASGVPHAVAWPTAEANIAAMDAAEAASASVQKVFSSYHSDGGYAASHRTWAPSQLMMLAMLVPMSLGTMLTSLRMG